MRSAGRRRGFGERKFVQKKKKKKARLMSEDVAVLRKQLSLAKAALHRRRDIEPPSLGPEVCRNIESLIDRLDLARLALEDPAKSLLKKVATREDQAKLIETVSAMRVVLMGMRGEIDIKRVVNEAARLDAMDQVLMELNETRAVCAGLKEKVAGLERRLLAEEATAVAPVAPVESREPPPPSQQQGEDWERKYKDLEEEAGHLIEMASRAQLDLEAKDEELGRVRAQLSVEIETARAKASQLSEELDEARAREKNLSAVIRSLQQELEAEKAEKAERAEKARRASVVAPEPLPSDLAVLRLRVAELETELVDKNVIIQQQGTVLNRVLNDLDDDKLLVRYERLQRDFDTLGHEVMRLEAKLKEKKKDEEGE